MSVIFSFTWNHRLHRLQVVCTYVIYMYLSSERRPRMTSKLLPCITWRERQGRTAEIFVVSNYQVHVCFPSKTDAWTSLVSYSPVRSLQAKDGAVCADICRCTRQKYVGRRFRFVQVHDRIFFLEYHYQFWKKKKSGCSSADSKALGTGLRRKIGAQGTVIKTFKSRIQTTV